MEHVPVDVKRDIEKNFRYNYVAFFLLHNSITQVEFMKHYFHASTSCFLSKAHWECDAIRKFLVQT